MQAVTLAVFSEAEGNSLLAGLEKAGASLRPEGFEGEVRLRGEQDSGGNTATRREKVNPSHDITASQPHTSHLTTSHLSHITTH